MKKRRREFIDLELKGGEYLVCMYVGFFEDEIQRICEFEVRINILFQQKDNREREGNL